jgi:hypothetical protein
MGCQHGPQLVEDVRLRVPVSSVGGDDGGSEPGLREGSGVAEGQNDRLVPINETPGGTLDSFFILGQGERRGDVTSVCGDDASFIVDIAVSVW